MFGSSIYAALAAGKRTAFAATLATAALLTLPGRDGHAYQCIAGAKWEQFMGAAVFYYKIDVNSFATPGNIGWGRPNFEIGDINSYVFWVNWAASAWRERTGLGFTLNMGYLGATSTESCLVNNDGKSTIGLVPGCAAAGCSIVATATPRCDITGTKIEEADICVYGGAPQGQGLAGWSIEPRMVLAAVDLVHSLVHEFGHAIGLLQHTLFPAVTAVSGLETGNTLTRGLFGDDITRAQSGTAINNCQGPAPCIGPAYGTSAGHIYWKEYVDGTSWGPSVALPPYVQTWHNPTAAIGTYGGNHQAKVVVGLLGTNQAAYFMRTDYPLRTGSAWDSYGWFGAASWRPPAIAARSTPNQPPLWVAAVALAQSSFASTSSSDTTCLPPTGCPGLAVCGSNDAFENCNSVVSVGGPTSASPICTTQDPVLSFDQRSGRFILGYVAQSKSWDNTSGTPCDARIHFRTSTDGVNWTNDQDTQLFTFVSPGFACRPSGANNCLLSYARGETTTLPNSNPTYSPNLIQRVFEVEPPTGIIVFGAATSDSGDWIQRTPPVAFAPFWGDRFWTGEHWTAAAANWAQGVGTLYSIRDYTIPQAYTWDNIGVTSAHTVALAASPNSERVYVFYHNP